MGGEGLGGGGEGSGGEGVGGGGEGMGGGGKDESGGGEGGGGEGDGGGGEGEGGGGEGDGGGGDGDGGGGDGGDGGGSESELRRCSETRRISSLVRSRGHVTTSAIAKSDFSLPYTPALTNSDWPPVPPVAVPTSTPFTTSAATLHS